MTGRPCIDHGSPEGHLPRQVSSVSHLGVRTELGQCRNETRTKDFTLFYQKFLEDQKYKVPKFLTQVNWYVTDL